MGERPTDALWGIGTKTARRLGSLGIHTEMWSDGALDLIECGAVDNSQKKVHAGKTVSGFVIGTRRLFDPFPSRTRTTRSSRSTSTSVWLAVTIRTSSSTR